MQCQRCSSEAVQHQKYCRRCRKLIKAEMKKMGYLCYTPLPGSRTIFSDERGRHAIAAQDLVHESNEDDYGSESCP